MNWVLKSLVQNAISLLPGRERINYFFQKRIARNLPVSEETLEEKVLLAARRVGLFERFGGKRVEESTFVEYGAGWDLIGPIAMYALGVRKQIVVDISRHVRIELINNALERIQRHRDRFASLAGRQLRPLPIAAIASTGELREHLGIDYRAPLDARDTRLPDSAIDFISTNSTLEHIPPESLPALMSESRRILNPEGVMCHFIDLKDHYSYADASITKYNFLKFSPRAWRFFDSRMQYQNRLRYPEYKAIIESSGFGIVYEECDEPTAAELQEFRKLSIHSFFCKRFSERELTVQIYRVVARNDADSTD